MSNSVLAIRSTGNGLSARFGWTLPVLAAAGAAVCAGQVLLWSSMGAGPFHDTADFWLAGRHVLEGAGVYRIDTDGYLNFIYGPPWAVLWAPISLLPLELVCALLFAGQVLALRYMAGSWAAAGLLCWLPFVPREFVTGNVDFVMGAAILAAIRGRTWPVVLFAFAKLAPAFVLIRATRAEWRDAAVTAAVLVAITVPWVGFWPQWITVMASHPAGAEDVFPALIRVPLALVLAAIPAPWALAASAGLLTPSFHFHTPVMLIPAIVLFRDQWRGRRAELVRATLNPAQALVPIPRVGVRGVLAAWASNQREYFRERRLVTTRPRDPELRSRDFAVHS